MSDQTPVPIAIVNAISKSMDNKMEMQKVNSKLVPDETICTRNLLIEAMKSGRIPGNAYVEWEDEQGSLRANVLDFLIQTTVNAIDPSSGQTIRVNPKQIPDRVWRVLY